MLAEISYLCILLTLRDFLKIKPSFELDQLLTLTNNLRRTIATKDHHKIISSLEQHRDQPLIKILSSAFFQGLPIYKPLIDLQKLMKEVAQEEQKKKNLQKLFLRRLFLLTILCLLVRILLQAMSSPEKTLPYLNFWDVICLILSLIFIVAIQCFILAKTPTSSFWQQGCSPQTLIWATAQFINKAPLNTQIASQLEAVNQDELFKGISSHHDKKMIINDWTFELLEKDRDQTKEFIDTLTLYELIFYSLIGLTLLAIPMVNYFIHISHQYHMNYSLF